MLLVDNDNFFDARWEVRELQADLLVVIRCVSDPELNENCKLFPSSTKREENDWARL